MTAWHFVRADRRLGYKDGRKIVRGRTLTVDGVPRLCHFGLHASERIIDALECAPGPIVCRVEIGGQIVRGDYKLCGTSRKVLWWLDATELLHLFACRVAERALKEAKVTDQRCFAAIKAKRQWLAGRITDEELDAARSAAESAAKSASRAATWAAAKSAARKAAWEVARSAAREAAWEATWAAAESAEREAEREAAMSAAWAAERAAHNSLLTRTVNSAAKRFCKGQR